MSQLRDAEIVAAIEAALDGNDFSTLGLRGRRASTKGQRSGPRESPAVQAIKNALPEHKPHAKIVADRDKQRDQNDTRRAALQLRQEARSTSRYQTATVGYSV